MRKKGMNTSLSIALLVLFLFLFVIILTQLPFVTSLFKKTGGAISAAPEVETSSGSSSEACVKECISSCENQASCLEECLYEQCSVEGPAAVSIRIV